MSISIAFSISAIKTQHARGESTAKSHFGTGDVMEEIDSVALIMGRTDHGRYTPMPSIVLISKPSVCPLYSGHSYAMRNFSRRPYVFQHGPRFAQRGFHHHHSKLYFTQFAQGRGTQYSLETSSTERINDMLTYYGVQKWGFVIYRCTYDDDSAWTRFMQHLNARKDAVLRDTYDDEYLARNLDWNVQEDSSLEHATKDEVRDRFKAWVATEAKAEMPPSPAYQDRWQGLLYENPRYKYCIHVDEESMLSVLNGPSPTEPDSGGVSYVNLIRADDAWEAWEQECSRNLAAGIGDDARDEGEPELEGRTSFDVGWMKISIDGLVPDVYEMLVNDYMWDNLYVRPNEGVWK